jgi:hypothetical protein
VLLSSPPFHATKLLNYSKKLPQQLEKEQANGLLPMPCRQSIGMQAVRQHTMRLIR